MIARIMPLRSRSEGAVLLGVAISLLAVFTAICFTDLNHPPGARWVRIGSVMAVMVLAVAEYKIAFSGVALFAGLFSQFLTMKFLYVPRLTAHWDAVPDITSWACAAGLAAAIAVRQLRTVPPDPMPAQSEAISLFYRLLPIALFALMAFTLLSAFVSFFRMRAAPESWGVLNANFRGLLSLHPLSELRPLWNALPIVANGILALALVRTVLFETGVGSRIKWAISAFVAAMVLAAVQFAWQLNANWTWPFHNGGPSGPFVNRNLAVPLMIMGAICLLWLIKESRSWVLRGVYGVLALVLCWYALRMGSRAGIVILLGLAWSYALAGAGKIRAILIGAGLPAMMLAALYWVPLPEPSTIQDETARRSVETLVSIRAGDWRGASTYRNELWYGAIKIWMQFPALGSGPGTYYLYVNYVPQTRVDAVKTHGVASFSAHSSPINLLAECGPLASLSWIYIFLVAPLYVLMTSKRLPLLSVALFAFGIVNLMDTAWYSDGAMTMASVWIATAIYEQKKDLAADSVS